MDYRKKVKILYIGSTLGVVLLILAYTNNIDRLLPRFTINPLYIYILLSLSLFPPTFFLLFCKEAVYHSWKRFTLWYSPFLFIMAVIPLGMSGGMIGGEVVSFFLGGLYIFISLLIIIIKSWKLRDKKKDHDNHAWIEDVDTFTTNKSKMDFKDIDLLKKVILSAKGKETDKSINNTLKKQGFKEEDIQKAFDELKEKK